MSKKEALSTEAYKGVRDFYPEDQAALNYITKTMRRVVESFGYEEYHASVLEPAELYKAKGAENEELANEQTYTFTDRGGREVTLRPEMTPTVARMVAAKRREFGYPLRLYSIPNVFRYERTQRGRLREHWQLNVDLFGLNNFEADVEILTVAHRIMIEFGLTEDQFEIRFNNRDWMKRYMREIIEIESESERKEIYQILDQRGKITAEEFEEKMDQAVGKERSKLIISNFSEEKFLQAMEKSGVREEMYSAKALLERHGVKNTILDPNLVRGFDYYTGMIFEVFDKNPQNNRSLFGGGRYDHLLEIFDRETIPAVGFGMGDVTIRDTLETYKLLPQYKPATDLYVCIINREFVKYAEDLADELRRKEVNVAMDYSFKKLGDQIKNAAKHKIPYVVVVGENEVKTNAFPLRNLTTGEEKALSRDELVSQLRSR